MRWTRFISTLAVAVSLATGIANIGAPTASAASNVKITAAYFDPNPSGPDPDTNAGRDAEYIVIRNSGTRSIRLTKWVLHDAPRAGAVNKYVFPSFKLGPGKTVRVHTGSGTNNATDLYWGKTVYVWGDDSDTATLQDGSGKVVSTCHWGTADTSPHYC